MLRQMPKLSDLCDEPKRLFDNFYQLGLQEYASVSMQWNFEFTEEALFVLAVLWAPSLPAFRRAVSGEKEAKASDDGASGVIPLPLRLEPSAVTYGAIRRQAFSQPARRPFELDTPGWGADRIPNGHVVVLTPFTYYFRSHDPVPLDEQPFAIKCNTKHDPNAHLPLG